MVCWEIGKEIHLQIGNRSPIRNGKWKSNLKMEIKVHKDNENWEMSGIVGNCWELSGICWHCREFVGIVRNCRDLTGFFGIVGNCWALLGIVKKYCEKRIFRNWKGKSMKITKIEECGWKKNEKKKRFVRLRDELTVKKTQLWILSFKNWKVNTLP